MTKKEIENRLAEINALVAEDDIISQENSRLYWETENKLISDLRDHLKDAGFPVNDLTRVDNRMYGFTTPENRRIAVSFKNKDGAEFDVTFRDKKVEEVRSTGIRSSGTIEDLNGMESYYKLVVQIMERLNSKYFSTNMSLFFETLEKYAYPEMKAGVLTPEIREERNVLNHQLKLLNLELEVGKPVEVYIEKTNRFTRSRWIEATVEKLTEKTVYVNCKNYGTKTIKRSDVIDKIRNVKTEGGAA
jgi:hypothetical protein